MEKIRLLASLGLFVMTLLFSTFTYAAPMPFSGATPLNKGQTSITATGVLTQYPNSYFAVAGIANLNASKPTSLAILAGKAHIRGNANRLAIAAGALNIGANIDSPSLLLAGTIDAMTTTRLKAGGTIVGGQVHWAGQADQNVTIIGGHVTISGQYHGDVKIIAGQLTVLPKTHITGKLSYIGTMHANISPQAQITGGIAKNLTTMSKQRSIKHVSLGHFILQLTQLWLVLIVLSACFPKISAKVSGKLVSRPIAALGYGLLTLVVGFIAIPVLLFTVIGSYLAMLWALTYILLLLLGYLYFAQSVGMLCLGKAKKASKSAPILGFWTHVLSGLIGLAILTALALLPIIGKWLILVLTVFGVGALILSCASKSSQTP